MAKLGGYMGKILDVDLTTKSHRLYPFSNEDRKKYLGGKTIAAKILLDELKPGIDPLSTDNILVFMTGPLTGTGAPCTSRFDVSTKSVMTGGIGSSNCGGKLGIYLKRAGYDGMIVRGKSENPVLLEINEKEVLFHESRHLWGFDTEEAQHHLTEIFGKRCGIAVIGPAGENLVRYACIISGERAAGRCGVGAVMGSKMLKGIVAWGGKKIPVHDEPTFDRAVKNWIKMLKENPITGQTLPAYGTANMVNTVNATGTLPTHNFARGSYENASNISGERLAATSLTSNVGCTSCPIRCGRLVRIGDKVVKGPEFETLGMFGPNIENDNLEYILEWNYLMDLLGMDTISAGSTIAFAMELNEKKYWDNGLVFGEFDKMYDIINDIAYRRGIGNDLAEGVMRLSRKYGGADFAMHVKGLEFSAYEPRRAVGHGLGYATSNRGGCHINGGYLIFFEATGPINIDPLTAKSKPGLCVFQQNMLEAVSASGNCIFTTYSIVPGITTKIIPPASKTARIVSDLITNSDVILNAQGKLLDDWMLPIHVPLIPQTETLSALTGFNIDLGHFASIGERGFTIERIFNLREGIGSNEDTLPERLTTVPQHMENPNTKVPIKQMMPVYYAVRDWDDSGIPTDRLLKKLDISSFAPLIKDIRKEKSSLVSRRESFLQNESDVFSCYSNDGSEDFSVPIEKREEYKSIFFSEITARKVRTLRTSRFVVNETRCISCGKCHTVCPVEAITWTKGSPSRIDVGKCVSCGKCRDICPRNVAAIDHFYSLDVERRKSGLKLEVDQERCKMCGLCSKDCPTGAIVWEKKHKSFINQDFCVKCELCRKACPEKFDAITLNGSLKNIKV